MAILGVPALTFIFILIRDEVALVVYLPEGLVGRAVNLELEDIYPVLRPADGVRPAYRRLDLGLDVVPEQREDQVDYGLEMLLGLVLEIVRDAGQEDCISSIAPSILLSFKALFNRSTNEALIPLPPL